MDTTPASLLERLRQPNAPEAWEHFVKLYTPLLGRWAQRLGLQGQDAADLVQEVFLVLVRKLGDFQYNPQQRFRGWLWTITLNKHRELGRRRSLPMTPDSADILAELPGRDDRDAIDEAEYRHCLVQQGLQLIKDEFQPTTWQAFWQCAVAERRAAEVANELGLSENAVYLAKGRVLRRLRRELEGLLD
jgi:RNA polymerase sigma-70 factor (ECF subfamily)